MMGEIIAFMAVGILAEEDNEYLDNLEEETDYGVW